MQDFTTSGSPSGWGVSANPRAHSSYKANVLFWVKAHEHLGSNNHCGRQWTTTETPEKKESAQTSAVEPAADAVLPDQVTVAKERAGPWPMSFNKAARTAAVGLFPGWFGSPSHRPPATKR